MVDTMLRPSDLPDSGSIYLLTAALCASVGAAFDLRTRRIPNQLTASLLLLGLLLHLGLGGAKAMGLAAAAGLAGGAVFLLFFLAGGMGGGDVKLMAAIASIAGLGHLVALMLATTFAGGVFALVVAISSGRLKSTLRNVGTLIGHHGVMGLVPHAELNLARPGNLRLPYGLAIAAGCWIILFTAVRA